MVDVAMELERAILSLAERRGERASLCPSEAARLVAGDDGFRALMPAAMHAAARLADRGVIEVLQDGEAVDPRSARGPVRLRLRAGG